MSRRLGLACSGVAWLLALIVLLTACKIPGRPTETLIPIARLVENANCRSGPTIKYQIMDILTDGTELPIQGRNRAGDSWLVEDLTIGKNCWVSGSMVEVIGDTSLVEIINPDPPGAPPFARLLENANCRSGPTTEYRNHGCPAGWHRITDPGTEPGWGFLAGRGLQHQQELLDEREHGGGDRGSQFGRNHRSRSAWGSPRCTIGRERQLPLGANDRIPDHGYPDGRHRIADPGTEPGRRFLAGRGLQHQPELLGEREHGGGDRGYQPGRSNQSRPAWRSPLCTIVRERQLPLRADDRIPNHGCPAGWHRITDPGTEPGWGFLAGRGLQHQQELLDEREHGGGDRGYQFGGNSRSRPASHPHFSSSASGELLTVQFEFVLLTSCLQMGGGCLQEQVI